ncbi:pentapeptide repeat-containing protein [Novipirellula galeiformis]|uniref:pentapeptide repeat-containing protein n=1 Tax=Novipirellula galeiformis TaxID=2528004 RepID=UPI0036F39A80
MASFFTSGLGSSFAGSSFAGSSFAGSSFAGSSFAGSSFAGSSFAGSSFAGSSFAGSSFISSLAPSSGRFNPSTGSLSLAPPRSGSCKSGISGRIAPLGSEGGADGSAGEKS